MSAEALWPSKDGSHLLFATFNDTNVRTLTFPWFGVSSLSSSSNAFGTFPDARTVRYPTVSAHFHNNSFPKRFGASTHFTRKVLELERSVSDILGTQS